MEKLTAPLQIKSAENDGTFEGYAAVYNNVDLGQDIITPGAFQKMLKTKDGKLRVALDHDLSKLAGKAEIKSDEHGLFVKAKLNLAVSYVKDAYELMKDGTLDGLSVGFNILKGGSEWEEREGGPVRILKALELWEFSIVPFGMNPEAKIQTVKNYSERDVEMMLRRDFGMSRKDAKTFVSGGKSKLQRDADLTDGNLKSISEQLKITAQSFQI